MLAAVPPDLRAHQPHEPLVALHHRDVAGQPELAHRASVALHLGDEVLELVLGVGRHPRRHPSNGVVRNATECQPPGDSPASDVGRQLSTIGAMEYRTLVLVDGENLVARFQAERAAGRDPAPGVVHVPDRFLWVPSVTRSQVHNILRVSYFTTVVGDDPAVAALADQIAQSQYGFRPAYGAGEISGFLCPHVFKKPKKEFRSKSVDINIAIDALRHSFGRSIDRVFLLSGDGDYLPLVQEVMRQGVQVVVGSLSNGLSPDLRRAPDLFVDLDSHFFKTPNA